MVDVRLEAEKLMDEGLNHGEIAKRLNQSGTRTARGRKFTSNNLRWYLEGKQARKTVKPTPSIDLLLDKAFAHPELSHEEKVTVVKFLITEKNNG